MSEPIVGGSEPIQRACIVGGAGFVGSHFVERLLANPAIQAVTVFDNFSSGTPQHLEPFVDDRRLRVVQGDVRQLDLLVDATGGHDTLIHLASNPDIAAAVVNPAIDFEQGTLLTQNVVEAARLTRVSQIVYSSGSGIYGDLGEVEADEDFGPLIPVSTYGASKLGGEALISAYCHMFGIRGCVFRFGNIVGPRQTHGVGFDFIHKLMTDSTKLQILGDGRQSKSYVHVSDVVDAVLLAVARAPSPFAVYNVATGDYITVRQIAELAVEAVGAELGTTQFVFTGGSRGWAGDVPVVRLNTNRIRRLGWSNRMSSFEAVRSSLAAIVEEAKSDPIQ